MSTLCTLSFVFDLDETFVFHGPVGMVTRPPEAVRFGLCDKPASPAACCPFRPRCRGVAPRHALDGLEPAPFAEGTGVSRRPRTSGARNRV